jgi:putative ABC transport system permease protein
VAERLRAGRAGALATFALVLVTAFLAAAVPRTVDRYQDQALRQAVAHARPQDRGLDLSATDSSGAGDSLLPSSGDMVEQTFRELVRSPIHLASSGPVYGARTSKESPSPDPQLPRTSPLPPAASLVAQAGLDSHVRVVNGRMPAPATGNAPTTVEAAVTQKTASVLHLRVGQQVHLQGQGRETVVVSGIVAPRDPRSPFWTEDDDLLAPQLSHGPSAPGDPPPTYWHFTMLVDRDATAGFLPLGTGVDFYWHNPVDTGRLTAHQIPAVLAEISSLQSGPLSERLQKNTGFGLRVDEGLGALLGEFAAQRSASTPLVLVATVGVGVTAFVVLLMAGGLAAERRRGETVLLRARGSSLAGVVRRLTAETAAVAVPGGAAGTALALLLLPTDRWLTPVLLGVGATLTAVLTLPLRAAASVRRARPAEREDVATARPSRRRLVAELTVLLLVAGAVAALRQRGADGAASGATGSGSATSGGWGDDPFVAAAPVLVAAAGAILLLRLYPVPLRLLARPTARLSGAVTHLGLARAGRSPSTGRLPMLAMLVALTVASFGGSVLAGVDHGRDRAATTTVGADVRVDAETTLAPQLPAQLRKVPGVGLAVTARVEPNSPDTAFNEPYSVVIVDPSAYRRLAEQAGLPGFPASALAGHASSDGVLPAVVSPGLAHELGGGTVQISTGLGTAGIRAAAVTATTPAAPGVQFVVISASALAALHPGRPEYPQYTGPTTMLLMDAPGRHIDTRALRAVTGRTTAFVTVLTRAEQRAAFADDSLQRGARRIFLAAVAAGAGYSALAMLLALLQAAPGRLTLLARLRTMGMTRGQARRLVLLEMLPQVLLTSVGGVLLGLAVVPLLGPGIDLRTLAFGTGPQDLPAVALGLDLRADPWSLVLPSAGLLVLACVVLLAQAWVSGRRRESTELRAGDRV